MNFFTHTVDASLWSSRTYEDPEYDDDPKSAEAGRATLSIHLSIPQAKCSTLIVAPHNVINMLKASVHLLKIGELSGPGVNIPIRGENDIVCICGKVDEIHHREVARVALCELQPERTLVIDARQKWMCRGAVETGVKYLYSSKEASERGAMRDLLQSPSFVDGIVAAFLEEAQYQQRRVVAAVAIVEEIVHTNADMRALYDALIAFVGRPVPDCIASAAEFDAAMRKSLKAAETTRNAMYL